MNPTPTNKEVEEPMSKPDDVDNIILAIAQQASLMPRGKTVNAGMFAEQKAALDAHYLNITKTGDEGYKLCKCDGDWHVNVKDSVHGWYTAYVDVSDLLQALQQGKEEGKCLYCGMPGGHLRGTAPCPFR